MIPQLTIEINKDGRDYYTLSFPYNNDLIAKIKTLNKDDGYKKEWDSSKKVWKMDAYTLYMLITLYKGSKDIFFDFKEQKIKEQFIVKYKKQLKKKEEESEQLKKLYEHKDEYVKLKQELEQTENIEDILDYKKYLKEGIIPYKHQLIGAILSKFANRQILAVDMGGGKAQPLTSLVLTPNGFVKMGDLKINDEIINSQGGVSHVTGIFPQGEKEIYKITFTDKTEVLCCGEHLWKVTTPKMRRTTKNYITLSVNEIINRGLFMPSKIIKNTKRFFIPVIKPIEFNKNELKIHPYVLGCLLGDGGLTIKRRIGFTSADQEIIDNLNKLIDINHIFRKNKYNKYGYSLVNKNNKKNYVINPNIYIKFIKELGLNGKSSHTKFIPEIYKYSSINDRIELLQGLLDTDGTLDKDSGSTYYTSVSETLIEDVMFIVRSLGGITKRRKMKVDKNGKFSFTITISLPPEIIPFKLKRKIKSHKPKTKYLPYKAISSIEKVGYEECQCISVDSEDHLYITDGFTLTHNTMMSLLCSEMYKEKVKKVLIVVPNSLKFNWAKEVEKFTYQKAFVLNEKKSNNKYTLEECKFVICNYDYFRSSNFNFHDKIEKYGLSNPDMMIFDESHKLKNTKSNTTKNITKFFKKIGDIPLLMLSGTPMPNRLEELFVQLNFVSPKEFPSKNKFYTEYCNMRYDFNYGWVETDKPLDLDKLVDKLSTLMYRVKKKDVLKNLPEIQINKIYLELTPEQEKQYQLIESGMAKISWDNNQSFLSQKNNDESFTQSNDNFLTLATKLRMFNSIAKFEIIKEYIQNFNEIGDKVVIFDQYVKTLSELNEHFKTNSKLYYGGIDSFTKQSYVDEFQNKESLLKNLFITTGSGNFGITLTASSKLFMLNQSLIPSENEQCWARIHRIGQENPVSIFIFIFKNTIDEYVDDLLKDKLKVISKVIDNEEYVDNSNIENSIVKDLFNRFKQKYEN